MDEARRLVAAVHGGDGPEPRAGRPALRRDARSRHLADVRRGPLVPYKHNAHEGPPTGGPSCSSAKRFTEPVTLSSTIPADFPPSALRLPRTASGGDFDLLASRARCEEKPMRRHRGDQEAAWMKEVQ